jgi:competence protein ComEC
VRLDLWAILVAAGIAVGTVAPPLAPVLLVAGLMVAIGALLWRDLVLAEWRLMAVRALPFVAGGVTIALLHAATPDPLAELAAMEPGEVMLIGRIASPPERSGFGYMADLRVERLWYEGREVLRGGGVEIFAADLSIGVGDRVRVDGEISRPQFSEDGFDYSRYLRAEACRLFSS